MPSYVVWVIIGTVYCTLVLAYLFSKAPFRPSQYILIVSMYSFCVRPLATAMCDSFTPFYLYSDALYNEGAVLGIACLCLFSTGLALGHRQVAHPVIVDIDWLRGAANLALLSCLVLDGLALMIYGSIFLPGERDAGLGITAPGSQIFFALVSVLTLLGTAIVVFSATSDKLKMSLAYSAVRFAMFFVLSMIFIQRGALLSGIVLGLFMSSIYSKTFYLRNIGRSLLTLAGVLFIAFQGRSVISSVLGWVTGKPVLEPASIWPDTMACQIANQSSQEHDQVWPTLLQYTSTYGADYYFNLVSALARSFLSSAQRAGTGFLTSVDTLNIYNNSSVYLRYNFGFSISPFQYHYFSVGMLALAIAFLMGIASSKTENTMAKLALNARGFIAFFCLYQLLLLVNGALDEQLRWSVLSCVLVLILAAAMRFIQHLMGQPSAQGPVPE